jgi:hypothetical protein
MFRVILSFGLLLVGCQASANAQVSAAGPNDATADGSARLESETTAESATEPRKAAQEPLQASTPQGFEGEFASNTPQALFGARAGLHLATPVPAVCQCLAVVVGQPNDSRFAWEGQPSVIDPKTQIAVALGSDGLDCPAAPQGSLGASYHGYSIEGQDVVISVESGRSGRPLTRGAIVPKPQDGGRLLVSPVNGRTPFGRPLDGRGGPCVVPVEAARASAAPPS